MKSLGTCCSHKPYINGCLLAIWWLLLFSAQFCPTLCNPMDCSIPDFPVPHHLTKFASVHVHCIGDAIQPFHPLFSFCRQSFPASGTFPISQLFTSDDENTGVSASVLPMSIQGWFPLRLNGLISLQSKGLSGDWYSQQIVTGYHLLSSVLLRSNTNNNSDHCSAFTLSLRLCLQNISITLFTCVYFISSRLF